MTNPINRIPNKKCRHIERSEAESGYLLLPQRFLHLLLSAAAVGMTFFLRVRIPCSSRRLRLEALLYRLWRLPVVLLLCFPLFGNAQKIIPIAEGWASNSVNTVVFRKNSLASYKDYQFISFYNKQQFVVLGKRKIGSQNWELKQTQYKGNARDAHNCISIVIDGDGYLHMAWDHHGNTLNYAKSTAPLSLELGNKISMTNKNENSVTYPEFYNMPDGNLLFLYRDGGSGRGNLVLNKYDLRSKTWSQLYSNLIDGEGKRNAYWQAYLDAKGTFHISWVWRESPDVASNHDMCYARSKDGGKTWEKSTGEKYNLPINAQTAEYALMIPQKSELINQTSMYADKKGRPFIATYWRDQNADVAQYRLIYQLKNKWQSQNLSFRRTPFSLSGGGTKRIPISRPQVIVWKKWFKTQAALIFRDEERGSKVSVAINKNLKKNNWLVHDIYNEDVGSWEPSYDTGLWRKRKKLHLFVQKTEQADAEGKSSLPPQMVYVLETDL